MHADGFFRWLVDRRFYSPLTAVGHLRLMAHLSRWLLAGKHSCSDVTEELVLEFVGAHRAAYSNVRTRRGVEPLIDFLREIGVVPEPVASSLSSF